MSIIFLYWRYFVGGWMFFGVLGGMLVKKVLAGRARTFIYFNILLFEYFDSVSLSHNLYFKSPYAQFI